MASVEECAIGTKGSIVRWQPRAPDCLAEFGSR